MRHWLVAPEKSYDNKPARISHRGRASLGCLENPSVLGCRVPVFGAARGITDGKQRLRGDNFDCCGCSENASPHGVAQSRPPPQNTSANDAIFDGAVSKVRSGGAVSPSI